MERMQHREPQLSSKGSPQPMAPSGGSSLPTGTVRILQFSLLASLLLAGEAVGLHAQFDRDLRSFIIAALLQGVVWAVAAIFIAHRAMRPSMLLILSTAVLLR